MKKNGFVMMETIICVAFLATSLIIVYKAFNTVLVNEKRRLNYDDPVYIYRTNYILNFLMEHDINSYLDANLTDENLIVDLNFDNPAILGDDVEFASTLFNDGGYPPVVYFTKYDNEKISKCINKSSSVINVDRTGCSSLEGLPSNLLKYIRGLGGYGKSGYRIIVQYKQQYTLDIGESEEESYKTNTMIKYYYSSLRIPTGG